MGNDIKELNGPSPGWQICPKCLGEGYMEDYILGNRVLCNLCKGKMIVNILTGMPPKDNDSELPGTKQLLHD